jgi:aldehyde dehydrogenase (NAD+)
VAGNREETTELLKLPFDFIFFTGSTKVGKVVAHAAAENLTPVLLELGGQNPALVDATANIKDAAKKIVWGAMVWGGQWCTRPPAMPTYTSRLPRSLLPRRKPR